MSFFVSAVPAPSPKTKNISTIGMLTAVIFAIMVVGQLFSYEEFPVILASLMLPGGEVTASVVAMSIVVCEVLALPFLLAMPLSPLFRKVSMGLGWLTVILWLFVVVWGNSMGLGAINSGLTGATVSAPLDWWNVFFILAIGVLVAWVSWGMWESRTPQTVHAKK